MAYRPGQNAFASILCFACALCLAWPCSADSRARGRAQAILSGPERSGDPGAPGLLHGAGIYFATSDGRAVYLAGAHTWTDNVSYRNSGQFDFAAYLDVLRGEGANLTRYWAPGSLQDTPDNMPSPRLFMRTGPGRAQDGGPKYDLSKLDPAYFSHVRADVEAAASKGVYVAVMLFFDYDHNGQGGWWTYNAWNGANNVNGTSSDNASIERYHDPHLLTLQHDYVARTIEAVRDLPNVLFEIANEASNDPATFAWQNEMVDYIHRFEVRNGGLRHPVGMTAAFPAGDKSAIDPALNASHADWISPNGTGKYEANPPDATGAKVQIVDSDHVFGIGGDANWIWQQFARGQNVLLMDDMSGTGLLGTAKANLSGAVVAQEASARRGIAGTRQAARLLDLARMAPADGLASTGFVLADPPGGQYVVYAPAGGSFSLDLSGSGGQTLEARWVDVGAGRLRAGGTITGDSGTQGFKAPFGGPAALVLRPAARSR